MRTYFGSTVAAAVAAVGGFAGGVCAARVGFSEGAAVVAGLEGGGGDGDGEDGEGGEEGELHVEGDEVFFFVVEDEVNGVGCCSR